MSVEQVCGKLMKKYILLLSLLVFANIVYATHNRAGEITYQQTADKTVAATITTYTKTSSIPADRDSLMICWGDGFCEKLARANGDGSLLDYDYKINYYKGTHLYQDNGRYTISMTDPNRNGSILNINYPNSDNIQFHLESTIIVASLSENATNTAPILLEQPIHIGFIRQTFMHTPNAFDLDGDSIAYELVVPLNAPNEPVPNYLAVDKIGEGLENNYSFDEQTGLFIWDSPQVVGEYNIAIQIKSYRNGVLQDLVLRDMQILIQSEENVPPIMEFDSTIADIIELEEGQTFKLDFTATDREDGSVDGSPTISATSEVFEKGATFIATPAFGWSNGSFEWAIPNNAGRALPYQVVFKSVDSKGSATFKVIRLKVKPMTTNTTYTFKEVGYQLFPNPATDYFSLSIPDGLSDQPMTISIFNTFGKVIDRKEYISTDPIIHFSSSHLNAGSYLISIHTAEEIVTTMLILQ